MVVNSRNILSKQNLTAFSFSLVVVIFYLMQLKFSWLGLKISGIRGPSYFIDQEAVLKSIAMYKEKFGVQDLRESVVSGLEHMARNTALMEGLGTNPVAMFDKLVTQLKLKNRDDLKLFDQQMYFEGLKIGVNY